MMPEIVNRKASYGEDFHYLYHPEHPSGECILEDRKFSSLRRWNTRHLAATKGKTVDVEAIEQAISWMRRTYPVEMKIWADKLTAALARQ